METEKSVDCDVCSSCLEHAEFDIETGESNCCGAEPYNTDIEDDLER
jgi:hypothetical protein